MKLDTIIVLVVTIDQNLLPNSTQKNIDRIYRTPSSDKKNKHQSQKYQNYLRNDQYLHNFEKYKTS
jgi:hypothetical protein